MEVIEEDCEEEEHGLDEGESEGEDQDHEEEDRGDQDLEELMMVRDAEFARRLGLGLRPRR